MEGEVIGKGRIRNYATETEAGSSQKGSKTFYDTCRTGINRKSEARVHSAGLKNVEITGNLRLDAISEVWRSKKKAKLAIVLLSPTLARTEMAF
ncbi:hypothetical protein AVEN_219867-1 [Araneus ventricosus]|uniref:Uncharacterized protein n=1 Tax=Araneus ventricosus TaxID=182803 RepID=A0A4Y2MX92_ARAVE|nr:hypothetical protein AVEN_219867-1 [Araneus ventricosus]